MFEFRNPYLNFTGLSIKIENNSIADRAAKLITILIF